MDIRTEHLFDISIEVTLPFQDLGQTPLGKRRIARISGGRFEGPRLRGVIQPGGGDWILERADGVTRLDVRIVLETDDGALIYMTYAGLRHGPAEVMARLAAGDRVDPADYYFRTAPLFETGAPAYSWLNGVVAVATGDRRPDGPFYRVFQVV